MFKNIVIKQYQELVSKAAKPLTELKLPNEGWIRTVRKSLNMTGTQLAKRLGVSKAWVSRTEHAELDMTVTIKTMDCMAKAMNCKFFYAFVPNENIENIIYKQAQQKAKQLVIATNQQMALEDQTVAAEYIKVEIERVTKELINNMPSNFWDY